MAIGDDYEWIDQPRPAIYARSNKWFFGVALWFGSVGELDEFMSQREFNQDDFELFDTSGFRQHCRGCWEDAI